MRRARDRDAGALAREVARFCAEVESAIHESRRFGDFISVEPGAPRVDEAGGVHATVDLCGIDRAGFYEVIGFLAAAGPEKPALDYPPVRRLLATKKKR